MIISENATHVLNTPIYEGMFFTFTMKDKLKTIAEKASFSAKKHEYVQYTYPKRIKNLFAGSKDRLNIYMKTNATFKYTDSDLNAIGAYVASHSDSIEREISSLMYEIYMNNRSNWNPKIKRFFQTVERGDSDQVNYWMNDLDQNSFYDFCMMDLLGIEINDGIAYMKVYTFWNSIIAFPIYNMITKEKSDLSDYIILSL